MEAVPADKRGFSPEEEFAPKPDVSGLSRIPLRVLILALLVVFVNSWLSAHLSIDLGKLLMVEALVALCLKIGSHLGKDDERSVRRAFRTVIEWLLTTPVLATASAILLIGTSLVSSVAVYAGDVEGIRTVRFCAEAKTECTEKTLGRDKQPVRFLRLTSPFGRPFFVEVRGFRRHSFELYPWFPRIIRVSTDLERSPSILFRVPYPHSDVFGGEIRILDAATGREIASGETNADSAALLIGPESQIPEGFTVRWSRQLSAGGHQVETHPQAFERWFNAARDPSVTLTPGARVNAYFFNRSQRGQNVPFSRYVAVARGVVVGGGSPQDVLLKREPKREK